MTDRYSTQEVKAFALKQLGADLVGVAGAHRFAQAPDGHWPEVFLPGARSVIVMAGRMLDSTFLSPNPRVYVLRYSQLCLQFQEAG